MSAYTVNNEGILRPIVPHGFQDLEILVLLEQIRETVMILVIISYQTKIISFLDKLLL